jgi:hypothetical protein
VTRGDLKRRPDPSRNDPSRNTARANGRFDLADLNAGCDGNDCDANRSRTANQRCIK